jgi:hypothetical protein
MIFGLLFVVQKCASQLPPPGGEVDKIPPTVIETYPQNSTTNFNDNFVEITFSEYVDKRAIRNAIFISPIIEGALEYSWTNKTVEITFPDTLRKNTTYSLIVGTEVTDVNNHNPMRAPFTLTFSTGSKIDSGKISGTVYDKKTEGTLIFAYKNKTDTLNIYEQKPDYISQVDEKGKFEFSGLGLGNYKLFAITDEFKNYVYNIGEDRIGIQSNEIKIKNNKDIVTKQNFFLMKEDTLEPHIQKVTMTDRNHFTVEFNEPIDSSKLFPTNFSVYDSTENNEYKIRYLFKSRGKNQYVLCLQDSLNAENKNYLNVENIFDKKQNILLFESIDFTVSNKADTTAPSISTIVTKYRSNTIDYLEPKFEITFNDAIDSLKAKRGIKFITSDSVNVPIKISFLDDAAIKVEAYDKLKPKKKYYILVNQNYFVDIAGNSIDTTIQKRILTVSKLDFTGTMGKVIGTENKNIKMLLEPLERNSKSIQTNLNKKSEFEFSRVMPGNYLLWAYDDKDSNNTYTFGTVKPFKYSEKFIYYPDTLKLKARWPVGDILIDFK